MTTMRTAATLNFMLFVPFVFAQEDLGDSVTFKIRTPKIGDVRQVVQSDWSGSKSVFIVDGAVFDRKESQSKTESSNLIEVLDTNETGITKLKLTVQQDDVFRKEGFGKDFERAKGELIKMFFIIQKTEAGLRIYDDEGKLVEKRVAELVKEKIGHSMGNWRELSSKVIPAARPVKIGETLNVASEVATKLFGRSGSKVKDMSLTLDRVELVDGTRLAVFKVKYTHFDDSEGPNVTTTMECNGEWIFGIDDSWQYSSNINFYQKTDETHKRGRQTLVFMMEGLGRWTTKIRYSKAPG